MLPWLLNALIGLKVVFCSCTPEVRRLGVARARPHYRVERLGTYLPRVVAESSGLARRTRLAGGHSTVWTHNDGGGRTTLYGFSTDTPGTLLDSLPLPQLRNVDWEDLAQQDSTRLFIADLGNNANIRRDLTIYAVDPRQVQTTDTIRVRYADQTAFPPTNRNFDCEAVFYHRDSLFLLSKNRSGHVVRLYGLPAAAGTYTLAPIDSVRIKAMVTGAAISPNGQELAVLTYGKILFFDLSGTSATRLNRPTGCLRIPRAQTEAITYLTDSELLMTNERGRVYRLVRR